METQTPKPARRLLLRAFGRLTGAVLGPDFLDSAAIEQRWIVLSRPTAAIAHLPPAWEGARIAQISDLHAGRLCTPDYLQRIVEVTNAASPDLIVLTGDHVSRYDDVTPDLVTMLSALRAPAGKLAILGNHDHCSNPDRVTAMLTDAGCDVLINSCRILDRAGQKLCVAGVDDLKMGRPDLQAALAGVDESIPRILLAHNPDYAEALPAAPRVDFMISGHTHGGQIRLPFGPAPFASVQHKKYTSGLVRGPRCSVYVSRGLGMVYLPFRFHCRPELPVFTLRHA